MNPQEDKHTDSGYLFSFNLMLIGGLLLLGTIVSMNKLLIHYSIAWDSHSKGILGNMAKAESETFRIDSFNELYLTWLSLGFSLFGLIVVIVKLVKTWTH